MVRGASSYVWRPHVRPAAVSTMVATLGLHDHWNDGTGKVMPLWICESQCLFSNNMFAEISANLILKYEDVSTFSVLQHFHADTACESDEFPSTCVRLWRNANITFFKNDDTSVEVQTTWPVWRGRTSQIRHTSQIRAAPPLVAFDSVSSMHRQEHRQSQCTTCKASTSELKRSIYHCNASLTQLKEVERAFML